MTPTSDARFESALHAFLTGDANGLRAELEAEPDLVDESWNSNTLLEWATQPPHEANPACVDVLIDAGASLNRALALAGCWNLAELCARLLQAGADPAALTDEAPITPLESAAMHGSTDAADTLVEYGLHRPTLWLAAATGRLDEVTQWASPTGELLKPAGPYRPVWAHVGRPEAPPPMEDPDQVLGEALTFAALNNRTETLDYLLDAGVPIDVAPYRGITGLHFAVQSAKTPMVQHLIDRGASLTARDDEWSATPRSWAEVCADGSTERAAIIEMLSTAMQ